MDLDGGNAYRGHRVAQGVGIVRVGARIEDHALRPVPVLVEQVDQRPLAVVLEDAQLRAAFF